MYFIWHYFRKVSVLKEIVFIILNVFVFDNDFVIIFKDSNTFGAGLENCVHFFCCAWRVEWRKIVKVVWSQSLR